MRELPGMSWRQFSALLAGLSPRGAVAAHYEAALRRQRQREARSDADAAQRAAASFWASAAMI